MSWSKTRKILEQEMICDSLKGRIQYFCTRYHGAPDNYGRFCVRVDGKEYVRANPYNENLIYEDANKLKKEYNIPRRGWEHGHYLYDEENRVVERIAEKKAMVENRMDMWQVMESIEIYRNLSINEALQSDNEVIRMFAILDRRVGKRTLTSLIDEVHKQPEWLKFFYHLRLSAEKIMEFPED